jgi:mannose-1-phosphate guanylyltransferase
MNRTAILLVGGMGTRLHPLTLSMPKPMLPVAGVPFTEHQIIKAREAGIKQIVLATSFKAEIFEPYFGNGKNFGIEIKYAVEKSPLGTGGAIRNAANSLVGVADSDPVAIFNGDVLSGHNLEEQFKFHERVGAQVSLYLTEVLDARAFGAVELDKDNRVLAFNEKMENPPTKTINAGCYIFNRNVISEIPAETVVSVERETFPNLLKRGYKVFGFVDSAYWLDIGTPAALLKASRDLISEKIKSAATPPSHGSSIILGGAKIDPTAKIRDSVIGANCIIGPEVDIDGSILFDGAIIESQAILKDSFVAPGFKVPANSIATSNFFGF